MQRWRHPSQCPEPVCVAAAPPLQGVSFAVFGLGNRQYEHFCAMGRKVAKALRSLGAAEVVPRGEGDDDADVDADFDRWCAQLFRALDASPELVRKDEVGAGCWVLGVGGARGWQLLALMPLSCHAADCDS